MIIFCFYFTQPRALELRYYLKEAYGIEIFNLFGVALRVAAVAFSGGLISDILRTTGIRTTFCKCTKVRLHCRDTNFIS